MGPGGGAGATVKANMAWVVPPLPEQLRTKLPPEVSGPRVSEPDADLVPDHAFDAELLQPFGGRRHANQSAAKFGHEIHGDRRDEFRRHDQIAFIFAIGVVHDDDHFAFLQISDDGFD